MKKIKRIVRDVGQHWVGDGFPVRNMFSYAQGDEFDPFLLLDYAGPHEFEPGDARRGVGEHPHRGFETVTILYQGELEHRDSSGSQGKLGPGDVQWMTAAAGVVHEEFHSESFTRAGGVLEMVQLWVNLPAAAKMSQPKYQDLRSADFPRVDLPGGGRARIIAGELAGEPGPASTFTPINIWDVQLEAEEKTELTIPQGHTTILIVQTGSIAVGDETARAVELVLLKREGTTAPIAAQTDARILVLTGEPIGEPVVGQGPFVMNTAEEIRAAIADYKAGKMGRLEG